MRKRIAVAAALIVVLVLSLGAVKVYQHIQREKLLAEQAHARALEAAEQAIAEQDFLSAHDRAVHHRLAAAALRTERKHTERAVERAREELQSTKGKVMDSGTRSKLKSAIEAAEDELQTTSPAGLSLLEADMSAKTRAVTRSHDAWTKEQERIAAEREAARQAELARQREAERQAELARQRSSYSSGTSAGSSQTSSSGHTPQGSSGASSASSSSSQSSSSSSSGSSSGSSQSSSSQKSSSSGGGGKTAQARSILSRYGCGGAGIKWDDPRMGAGANGTADWYNNTVLLNSSMPSYRFTYVVAHECVHLIQYRVYGGDINALQRDMNAIYGGSGFSGLEQNADCVTQRWGISVSNYTSSCGGARGSAAAAIAAGHKP